MRGEWLRYNQLKSIVLFLTLLLIGCIDSKENKDKVKWSTIQNIELSKINSDIKLEKPTIDIGIYYPSNLDSSFNKVDLKMLIKGFNSAKKIYEPANVQLNLLWIKTGNINKRFLSIQANEIPTIPRTEYLNMYEHMKRHPAKLTEEASMAFQSIIEPSINNHRTIYLIILQDVFFPF